MHQKKKKWAYYSIVFCLLFLTAIIGYVLANRPYMNGVVGINIGLREARPHVFVSPDIAKTTLDRLLATIDSAIARNETFWGSPIDVPNIIYCHNQEMADRYTSGHTHAESLFTPFSYHVVVTETGLTTDMISHELAHVVLFNYIQNFKWYIMTYRVPVWFDEGLAMQVDHRESYSTEKYMKHTDNGTKAPTLGSMASIPDFYQPDTLGWYRYATSKHEVGRWLQKVNKQGLEQLIKSTTLLSDFQEQYQRIEASSN